MSDRISLNTAYITTTAVVFGGIVFVFLVLQPMVNGMYDTREEIQQQTALLRQRKDFLSSIDQKVLQIRSQQEHEARLNVILPTGENIEDALRIMHQGAQDTGVVIVNISNESNTIRAEVNAKRARGEELAVPELVEPVGVKLSVEGTYQQFRAYLDALERAPRIMDVVQFSLSRSDQQSDQIAATMSVQFYVQREPVYLTE